MLAIFTRTLIFLGLVTALSCAHSTRGPASVSGERLNEIISTYAESIKRVDPFFAPYFNIEADLDKFGDFPSPAYFERERAIYDKAQRELVSVNPADLLPAEKRTYDLFKEDIEISLKNYDFPNRYLALNQMSNRLRSYLDDSSQELTTFPFDSVKHYENFITRSEGFPAFIDNQIALLRDGIKAGIVLGCEVAKEAPNSYKDGLATEIEKHPFWRPVTFMPKDFSAADRQRLTEGFRTMVKDRIIPGYAKFDAFFKNEYLPKCGKGFGISKFKNSKAWYAQAIRASTNLKLTAKEIHQTGLKEVARIAGEIEKIKDLRGFKGDLPAFLKSLREDPQYFFTSAKEMFSAFENADAEVKKRLPQYFSLTPKSELRIVESSNPEDPAGAYYQPTENVPYGRFVVNTKSLRSVPKYGVTTLMIHEAIPGHHFQLALQFEMKDELSEYQRKVYFSNAFAEGWALYTEYLGNEMGLFTDPLQKLGNLNDEMLRAVRLVVDTGIHDLGWSQKKVMAYMSQYLANDANDIENEANRYSVWPGQALGYKIGQLKIIDLRHWAEKELGPKFDIREFHKVVIGNGTVSLSVLDAQVKAWVEKLR